jgi:hypothetical protein
MTQFKFYLLQFLSYDADNIEVTIFLFSSANGLRYCHKSSLNSLGFPLLTRTFYF